jgi:hypothetical protein
MSFFWCSLSFVIAIQKAVPVTARKYDYFSSLRTQPVRPFRLSGVIQTRAREKKENKKDHLQNCYSWFVRCEDEAISKKTFKKKLKNETFEKKYLS